MHPGKSSRPYPKSNEAGFSYLLLLFVIALLGISLTRVSADWTLDTQREKEADLLFAGRQARTALRSYVAATPEGKPRLPRSIDDLLEDHRIDPPRRHLRRRYIDPFTGKPDWLPIQHGEWLIGISSQSNQIPITKTGFEPEEDTFPQAKRYRDWHFKIEVPTELLKPETGSSLASPNIAPPMGPR